MAITTPSEAENIQTVINETYRGHLLEAVTYQIPGYTRTAEWTTRDGKPMSSTTSVPRRHCTRVAIEGRSSPAPTHKDVADLTKKLRTLTDGRIADDEIRPRLARLIHATKSTAGYRTLEADEARVNMEVWVDAMGHIRRGLVTKRGRKLVEVAYTTASGRGRVFRKSALPSTQIWVRA